jgi:hypothetical protein
MSTDHFHPDLALSDRACRHGRARQALPRPTPSRAPGENVRRFLSCRSARVETSSRDERNGREPGVRQRAIGSRLAPVSVERQQRRRCYRVPCIRAATSAVPHSRMWRQQISESRSRRHAVTPEQPISRGSTRHGTPVTSTNRMAANAMRSSHEDARFAEVNVPATAAATPPRAHHRHAATRPRAPPSVGAHPRMRAAALPRPTDF